MSQRYDNINTGLSLKECIEMLLNKRTAFIFSADFLFKDDQAEIQFLNYELG
jgi:hypothetical protein